jgi:hypothetical protein
VIEDRSSGMPAVTLAISNHPVAKNHVRGAEAPIEKQLNHPCCYSPQEVETSDLSFVHNILASGNRAAGHLLNLVRRRGEL